MDQPTPNSPSRGPQSAPFEMPPNLTPPEPMGGNATGYQGNVSVSRPTLPVQPATPPPTPPADNLEIPHKSVGPYLLMGFLILILAAGIILFSAWKGWISFWGLDKLFGGTGTSPTPVAYTSISPSPTVTTSSEITANVNDQTRKKDLANIKNVLKKYFAQNAQYPQSATITKTSDSASVLTQVLVPTYLEKLPDDPNAPQYYYGYKSDGKTFELTCILEDKSDVAGVPVGSLNIYKITESSVE